MSHSNYDKPLDIQWLCATCHHKRDHANPKGGTIKKEGDWSAEVVFLKRDDSKRLVYGVVLEPGDPKHTDAQKDWLKAEEIEPAAHDYLKRYYAGKAAMGLQHEQLALDTIPVESYIAPADFRLGAKLVKKGSWVMVSFVGDDKTWEKVTKGLITGYSIGGRGERHVS